MMIKKTISIDKDNLFHPEFNPDWLKPFIE